MLLQRSGLVCEFVHFQLNCSNRCWLGSPIVRVIVFNQLKDKLWQIRKTEKIKRSRQPGSILKFNAPVDTFLDQRLNLGIVMQDVMMFHDIPYFQWLCCFGAARVVDDTRPVLQPSQRLEGSKLGRNHRQVNWSNIKKVSRHVWMELCGLIWYHRILLRFRHLPFHTAHLLDHNRQAKPNQVGLARFQQWRLQVHQAVLFVAAEVDHR